MPWFLRARHSFICCLLIVSSVACPAGAAAPEVGLTTRVPWANIKLQGSPEPPLPYVTEPAFTAITWERPIYAKAEPGTTNLIVVLQGGEQDKPSRMLRLDETQPTRVSELLSMEGRLVYGLAFDPDYETNGFLYLFSNGPTSEPERKNRISRFHVRDTPARDCDATAELVIIEWRSMGHDGGELGFGADGMLYISSGDGTSDSDGWLSGQDISNVLGGVLRIDVRDATAAAPYKVPPDNPFLNIEGARGELWAFGLRNPWRLWCDNASGQIWVGNNGQDLWETIHLIRRGENYGWSVYEGSHPFYAQRQRGPVEIVPPTIEHHHTEARSLTGGVVYRGTQLPELDGAYIYGDYSTGRIWGARHDGAKIVWHQELADTSHQIAGFAIAPSGALLVVDLGGSLHRLTPAPAHPQVTPFPVRLSETDLFVSVAEHILKPGIVPYSVNAAGWNDHAAAERFFAVPDDKKISTTDQRGWNLPEGSVLGQTLSLPHEGRLQRVETRLLIRQQHEWTAYTYRWNEQQTDATLVPKSGEQVAHASSDGTTITWQIPSRAECMSCHSRAVNFVLGLSTPQMNRPHDYGSVTANQLSTLHQMGLLQELPNLDGPPLVDPYDTTQTLDARARSYLHVNCSCCHVEAGGGNTRMELEFARALKDMRLVSARPQHATFEIRDAMLVAPGEPNRSVLLARISRRGTGQMPPLYTRVVDQAGVKLIHEWVATMPRSERVFVRDWTTEELVARLDDLTDQRSPERGRKTYQDLGCIQCHRIGDEGGGAGPDLSTITKRLAPAQIIQSIVEPSAAIAAEYALTMVTTSDGRALRGRIEYEDANVIRLRSPESFDVPVTVEKSKVDVRALSTVSMMPEDMLNSCSVDEILDLLAYLVGSDTTAQRTPGGSGF